MRGKAILRKLQGTLLNTSFICPNQKTVSLRKPRGTGGGRVVFSSGFMVSLFHPVLAKPWPYSHRNMKCLNTRFLWTPHPFSVFRPCWLIVHSIFQLAFRICEYTCMIELPSAKRNIDFNKMFCFFFFYRELSRLKKNSWGFYCLGGKLIYHLNKLGKEFKFTIYSGKTWKDSRDIFQFIIVGKCFILRKKCKACLKYE